MSNSSPPAAEPARTDHVAAAVLDELPDVVIRFDADGRIRYVNAAFEAATGLTAAEALGRTGAELGMDAALTQRFQAARDAARESGRAATFELRRHTPEGMRCIQYRVIPERHGGNGGAVTLLAIGRDVTELVTSEAARRESERRLGTLLSNVPGMAYRMRDDAEWTAEFVSQGALPLTGYAPERFLTDPDVSFERIIHPDDRARVRDRVHAALAEGVAFELTYRIVRADGAVRWVWEQGRGVPSGDDGPRVVEGLVVDVTDREEAVLALESERARLAEAQRIARIGSWTWNFGTGAVHLSSEWDDLVGESLETRRDPIATFAERVAPEERERFDAHGAWIRAARPARSEGRWVVVRPDGQRRVVQMRSEWTYDAAGAPLLGRGTFQDVTEIVEAQHEVARHQALLEESQRLAAVGSWELELATNVVRWSDEMYRIAGLDAGTPMTLERVRDSVHPDDRAITRASLAESIATQVPIEYECRMVRPDGSVRTVQARTRAMPNADGRVTRVVGTCQDVTDRRQLEAQVAQSQKMEALGLLAGGVAHDFNNLLSAIIGGAELARLEIPDDSAAAEDLEEVRGAANRAAQLTRQLLTFSRKQVQRPRVIDLGALVTGTERLLRRLLPDEIVLDLGGAAGGCVVRADPGQLEQVLMNLVVNARDAMEQGGTLTIETANATLDQDYAVTHPEVAPGEYVMMSVSDTGIGMDADTVAHVFEPFFTTKSPGKGTGLGLATCYGIVRQNGGSIYVYSEKGHGSTFKVFLPRVWDAATPRSVRAIVAPEKGSEVVLVVEDDEMVRKIAVRILRRQGYVVHAAEDGITALRMFDQIGGEIDILVTDVVMPNMSGKELAVELRRRRPDLRILYTSGYTENTIVHHGFVDANIDFLAKPYVPSELLRRVREVLDRA